MMVTSWNATFKGARRRKNCLDNLAMKGGRTGRYTNCTRGSVSSDGSSREPALEMNIVPENDVVTVTFVANDVGLEVVESKALCVIHDAGASTNVTQHNDCYRTVVRGSIRPVLN